MEDIELLELLKNSPHEGLAAVVKQYSAYVYKIAYTRLGRVCSREDIEEAVSDIFMRFFLASQNDGTEIRSVCAYLAAVSQRHCINIFQRQIKRTPEISLDEIEDTVSYTYKCNKAVENRIQKARATAMLYCQVGGNHCEADWEKQVPIFMDFLWRE